MEKEDNVVFVLNKAIRHFQIKVTKSSIKDFLLSHPYYPTLKSVCDALEKWKVEYYPLNLDIDEIKSLEMPFIAHLNIAAGQLVFVEKIEAGQITYYNSENKSRKEEFEKFSGNLSGAVVVMEAKKNSGENEYSKKRQDEIVNKTLLPLCIVSVVVLVCYNLISNYNRPFFQSEILFWGLLITKILGFTASTFLVLHEFKLQSRFTDKICSFSSKTDCDTVLTSNASRLLGWINWADAGLVYFTGTFLYITTTSENYSLWVLSLLSVLALPYPVFSIYYQAFKAKKWCPFCLVIQIILISEFVLLLPIFQRFNLQVTDIVRLIVSFLIPMSLWLINKAYHITFIDKKRVYYSYLGFKRNPEIFSFLLTKNGKEEIHVTKDSLVFGAPDSPVILTAFLSLYCNPCADAFKQLKVLLESCPDLKVNIVFSVYGDDLSRKLINSLYYIYGDKGPSKTIEFLDKWFNTPRQGRMALSEKQHLPAGFDVTETVGEENKKLFEKLKVTGTPTIYVNGYKYPAQYNYSDLENFMDELKQITVESKRQEACVNSN
jgi:uncharacterized membrane protein